MDDQVPVLAYGAPVNIPVTKIDKRTLLVQSNIPSQVPSSILMGIYVFLFRLIHRRL